LPGPIPRTARWDLKAIDMRLDAALGSDTEIREDAFERWKRERDEK